MTPPVSRHFVTVWNPSYASDAMEAHLSVLLHHAARWRDGAADEDDVYVWWGKVRSSNRQQRLPHLDECLAIGSALAVSDNDSSAAPPETHLYLTDYRSLYVGDVDYLGADDPRRSDAAHVPAYYAAERLSCDFWWRIRDVRLLVANDLPAVLRELQALRNTRYADRPVSLYGGMVDLPLVVTRPDGRRYFDEDERARLADDRLWVEFDREHAGGVGEMERELRENHFGDALWASLDPAARRFVATAERAFRDHRGDAAFDFSPVVVSFAKAVELQCNLLLRAVLKDAPAAARRAKVGDRTVDLGDFRSLSLGELARAIGDERALNDVLHSRSPNGRWASASLAPILSELASVRNPGAHASRVDRETATRWRNRLIGVGCVGDLVELARAMP